MHSPYIGAAYRLGKDMGRKSEEDDRCPDFGFINPEHERAAREGWWRGHMHRNESHLHNKDEDNNND